MNSKKKRKKTTSHFYCYFCCSLFLSTIYIISSHPHFIFGKNIWFFISVSEGEVCGVGAGRRPGAVEHHKERARGVVGLIKKNCIKYPREWGRGRLCRALRSGREWQKLRNTSMYKHYKKKSSTSV